MGLRKSKRKRRNEALQRYYKHRNRNLIATPGMHPFTLILDHLKAGFNVAKIFRSAEIFGAAGIHLIDIGPFDPAPAKGGFKRVPAHFHTSFTECYTYLNEQHYRPFTLEAGDGIPLTEIELPPNPAFIFGHEERGLSFDPTDYPDIQPITIPQFGLTESLNVSIAASIVMYEYIRQHGRSD